VKRLGPEEAGKLGRAGRKGAEAMAKKVASGETDLEKIIASGLGAATGQALGEELEAEGILPRKSRGSKVLQKAAKMVVKAGAQRRSQADTPMLRRMSERTGLDVPGMIANDPEHAASALHAAGVRPRGIRRAMLACGVGEAEIADILERLGLGPGRSGGGGGGGAR
jgi:hypothetical protein